MNTNQRMFAVFAVAMFMLSCCVALIPSENSDASVEETVSAYIISSEGSGDGVTKFLKYDGENDIEIRFNTENAASGDYVETLYHYLEYRCVDGNYLSGYDLEYWEIWEFSDGRTERYNGGTWLSIPDVSFWYSNSTGSNSALSLQANGAEAITLHARIVNGNGGPQISDNEVTFRIELTTDTVYKYTTSVSFDTHGGNTINAITREDVKTSQSSELVEIDLPAEPTNINGQQFDGWSTSNGGNVIYEPGTESIKVTIGSEITLHAIWTTPQVTITFWDGGEQYDKVSIDKGTKVSVPDEPEKEGMFFLGWFTEETCTALYDFNTVVNSDMNLFAGWEDELEWTTTPTAHGKITLVDGTTNTYYIDATASEKYSSVLWDFGNGVTSDKLVDTISLEPGTYHVKLYATNNMGTVSYDLPTLVVPDADDGDGELPVLWIVAGVLAVILIAIVAWRFLL